MASTPAKNFDGSAVGKNDGLGELTEDNSHKSEKSSTDKNAANAKKDPNAASKTGDGQKPADNKQQTPPMQPAAPAPTAPEPGGGVSKGKN